MKLIFNILTVILIISVSACGPERTNTEEKTEKKKTPVNNVNPELSVVKDGDAFVVKRYTSGLSLTTPADWEFGLFPQKDRAVIGAPCDSGAMCPLFFIAINLDSTNVPLAQRLNNFKQEIYLGADSATILNESLSYTVDGKPAFLLDYTYVYEGEKIAGTYVLVKHKESEEINFSILFPGVKGDNYKKYWEQVILPVLKSVNIE